MMRRSAAVRIRRVVAWLLAVGALSALPAVSALAHSRTTPASIDFTPEPTIRPVSPVDPDRPDEERGAGHPVTIIWDGGGTPIGDAELMWPAAGATGASGWLSINYVTPLNYGRELGDGVFTVQQERPYLQTSDLRGTATGWKVTAVAGPFQDPVDLSPIPALLSFSCGSANGAHTYLSPPDIPTKIELPANGRTQRLIELAEENQGVGIWVARWYPENGPAEDFRLQLFSPAAKGRLGFVLWVMNDAP